MDNNIDEQIQKLEQLQKLYRSEDFEQHNAFGIAIIEELKTILVSKNESLHDVINSVCPKCGYPKFKKHHEDFERCNGCDWTSK